MLGIGHTYKYVLINNKVKKYRNLLDKNKDLTDQAKIDSSFFIDVIAVTCGDGFDTIDCGDNAGGLGGGDWGPGGAQPHRPQPRQAGCVLLGHLG